MENFNAYETMNDAMLQIDKLVNRAILGIKDEMQRNPENSQFLMELLSVINTIADCNDLGQSNLHTLPEMAEHQTDFFKRATQRRATLDGCSPETENSRAFH